MMRSRNQIIFTIIIINKTAITLEYYDIFFTFTKWKLILKIKTIKHHVEVHQTAFLPACVHTSFSKGPSFEFDTTKTNVKSECILMAHTPAVYVMSKVFFSHFASVHQLTCTLDEKYFLSVEVWWANILLFFSIKISFYLIRFRRI